MEKAFFKSIFHHLRNRPDLYYIKDVLKKSLNLDFLLSKVSD